MNWNPNVAGFGYGYRQAGMQRPTGVGMALTPQGAMQNPAARMAPQAPTQGGLEALKQAMIAQSGQSASDRMMQSVNPMMGFGSKTGVAGGLAMGYLADRQARRSEKAAASAAEAKTQQASEQLQKQAKAAAQFVLNQTGDVDLADSVYQAVAAGMEIDLAKFLPKNSATESTMSREQRVEFASQNPDLFTDDAELNAFILYGKQPAGTTLQVDKDGVITFATGGATIPEKRIRTDVQHELRNAEESIAALESIAGGANRDYLTNTGRIEAWFGGHLDRFGLSDEESAEFNAERAAWVKELEQRILAYRKEITGVAGSVQEMERIEKVLANPRMGPAEFKKTIENEVRLAREDANRRRAEMGLEKVDWPEYTFEFQAEKPKVKIISVEPVE